MKQVLPVFKSVQYQLNTALVTLVLIIAYRLNGNERSKSLLQPLMIATAIAGAAVLIYTYLEVARDGFV